MKKERIFHRIVAVPPYLCGLLFTLLLAPACLLYLVAVASWYVNVVFRWLCTNERTKTPTLLFIAWWWSETLGKIIKAWNSANYADAMTTALVFLFVTWIYHHASKSSDSAKSKD